MPQQTHRNNQTQFNFAESWVKSALHHWQTYILQAPLILSSDHIRVVTERAIGNPVSNKHWGVLVKALATHKFIQATGEIKNSTLKSRNGGIARIYRNLRKHDQAHTAIITHRTDNQ